MKKDKPILSSTKKNIVLIASGHRERGFILPIVLSIILVITLLAVNSTDVLRISHKIEQSKDRQHIAAERAKQTLRSAETVLKELQLAPPITTSISRNSLDPNSPIFWDSNITNYFLSETNDKITQEALSHYVQNRNWWSEYGNPVLDTTVSLSKAGYVASQDAQSIGYFILEDFNEVIEVTQLSQNPDYHRRSSSKLYAITTFGDFNETSSARLQSYYIKNFY